MNIDALPIDVLVPAVLPVALVLWLAWALVLAYELGTRRADRMRDRRAYDRVQREQAEAGTDDATQHREEHHVIATHGRSVPRASS